MQPKIYQLGDGGIPTRTGATDLSDRLPSVEFGHGSMWGPLSARISWTGTLDEGFYAADSWLGAGVELRSPDGAWLWEGQVRTIEWGAGRRRRTRSLEGYANRVRVHTSSGAVVVADDTAGQARYGVIEYQHSAGTADASTLSALAARVLAERSRLFSLPGSGSIPDNDPGAATITLECAGWYVALGNQAYLPSDSTSISISTLITAMLDTLAPFLSSDRSQIEPVAQLTTRQLDMYETPRDIIKRVVGEIEDGWVFGIGPGRVPYLRASRRMATRPTYTEQANGTIFDASGSMVAPWLVRPDTIIRQQDFAPASAVTTAAIDAIENVYVVSTSYRDGTVDYESAVAGVLGEISG